MKKILIFGHGQLGTLYAEWWKEKGNEVFTPTVDIRNAVEVEKAVADVKPDLIINTAAKTNIDWCEENRSGALAVNTLGADAVASAAQRHGVFLIHLSSGCIQESLSSEDVKKEEDTPHPVSFYGWTKVWAENLVLERARRDGLKVLVLRPRQLLSSAASPRNALVKFLTYSKFIDVPQSCTIVEDLLKVTEELVRQEVQGVYNVVNPGLTSPFSIAKLLRDYVEPTLGIEAISKDALNHMTKARRIDTVLSTSKLQGVGITLVPIEERLKEILPILKTNLNKKEGAEALAVARGETAKKLMR